MAWLPIQERAALRERVEAWLREHRDPRDPLTAPVELLLCMFLAATSWRGLLYPVLGAATVLAVLIGAPAGLVVAIASRDHRPVVEVSADEQPALQQWATSGEMSRLMRCDGDGLVFQNGHCHTAPGAGWLIPLPAQQLLAAEGHDRLGETAIDPDQARNADASRNHKTPHRAETGHARERDGGA